MKTKHKILMRAFIFSLLVLIIAILRYVTFYIEEPNPPIIYDAGVYEYEEGVKIHVIVVNGFVRFFVSKDEKKIIVSTENISTYQRWFLLWEDEKLWVHSSDIGDFVWEKDEGGTYHNRTLEDFSGVPDIFYKSLPNSIK